MTTPELSSRDRAHLRSLAHHLEPVVRLGAEGLTEGVVGATSTALEEHELIKVRFGPGFVGDRRSGARELAEATGAKLVQLIGRVAVLYRPPPSAAKGAKEARPTPKIVLPGSSSRTTRPPG
jgi:RNA-binding protein